MIAIVRIANKNTQGVPTELLVVIAVYIRLDIMLLTPQSNLPRVPRADRQVNAQAPNETARAPFWRSCRIVASPSGLPV